MKELRTLLIDCRIALRNARSDEERDALSERIESAIQALAPAPEVSLKTAAHQVALAWQTAARGLMLSHPELYEELKARVMVLLDTRSLDDPDSELLALEQRFAALEKTHARCDERLGDARTRIGTLQQQLDALYCALAAVAPRTPGLTIEPQQLALEQIAALAASGAVPVATRPVAGAPARPVEADGPVPSRAVLEAVRAGSREFSKEQREWAVGEALGLTHWEFTPVELIEKGDVWLAQLILDRGAAVA